MDTTRNEREIKTLFVQFVVTFSQPKEKQILAWCVKKKKKRLKIKRETQTNKAGCQGPRDLSHIDSAVRVLPSIRQVCFHSPGLRARLKFCCLNKAVG